MGRIIKWLFILALVGFVVLAGYTFIGPFFGVDFAPIQTKTTVSIELNEK